MTVIQARRTLLKAAGSLVLVCGGALGWRAWDQGAFSSGEGPAYEPWKSWQPEQAGSPRRLVAAALLAANPHNTQPWRFRIAPASIDLFADRTRNIGSIDPYLREMHVGLGCALENLSLAAAAEGFEHRIALFPSVADAAHIARIELAPGAASPSPLYRAIPRRHTNRAAYDASRPLPVSVLDQLQALGSDLPLVSVKWFIDPAARRKLGELIVLGTEAIIADPEQSRDSGAWFRGTWQDIQSKRDGLTVDAQALPGWLRFAAKVLPPVERERSDQIWLKRTREVQVASAAAFGLLLARDAADNANRVQGGRLWQRMHLWAESQGIAMQPLNQLPERADRERSLGMQARFGSALEELVDDAGWRALMPFRLGYPTVAAPASPRRGVEQVLLA